MAQKLCNAINGAQRAREAKAREDTVLMAKKKEGLFWEKREQAERLQMKKEETRSRGAEVPSRIPFLSTHHHCPFIIFFLFFYFFKINLNLLILFKNLLFSRIYL
jgi:hypothetical protein